MSTDAAVSQSEADRPGGPRWRAEAAKAQEAALPSVRALVSCPAQLGVGGLGRHLREIVDTFDRRGQPAVCVCESSGGRSAAVPGRDPRARALTMALAPLVRPSPAWRMWTASVAFDAGAARHLPPAEHLLAFSGTALAQFRAATRARYSSISLVSATSHLRRVVRQHERAYRQYPLEGSWATHLLRRNLAEYARADRIYVASRYIWESFIEEGFPEETLSLFPLTPDPRYTPDASPPASAMFDIVYIGSLSVAKGVPLLVDAVSRLPHTDMRLVLVGGWGTRGMRRFIEKVRAHDSRINVTLGDPLPHVRAARLCVHPSYDDGFAYAPAEALATGVPVIVSENTGMKDLIDPGRNGLILQTGHLSALTEAIDAAYHGEILHG